jgi:signal transduction histidine kinase
MSDNVNTASIGMGTGLILVVDDEEKNRKLLSDLLRSKGHKVILAEDGEEALRMTREENPDVILLDVMMPKLNGYEVCKELQNDTKTRIIPVLMVTSLSERNDRIKGISMGAYDFISKPIDSAEISLRVRNAVHNKQLHDRVQQDLENLRELEQLRDDLVNLVVHDMKSPLFGISGYLELLQDHMEGKFGEEQQEFVIEARKSCRDLLEMIRSLLDISRMEEGSLPLNKTQFDLNSLAEETLKTLNSIAEGKEIEFAPATHPTAVTADSDILKRIISNLVTNALKFTPLNKSVRVTVESNNGEAKISVADNGPGIPAQYRKTIFEKFGRVKQRREHKMFSTGLGLTFCKLATEAHGGEIGLKSKEGEGSTFWFTIPR